MNTTEVQSRIPWLHISVFVFLVSISLYVAFDYYSTVKQKTHTEKFEELLSVGDLKSKILTAWRSERFHDANVLRSDILLAGAVKQYRQDKGDRIVRKKILSALQSFRSDNQYYNILLLDPLGRVLLYTTNQNNTIGSYLAPEIKNVVSNRSILFADFHSSDVNQNVHLDIVTPLLLPMGKDTSVVAVIVLRIDPNYQLYPFVQSWPTASRTSESVLFRVEDDSIIFLNKLRYKDIEPLRFRLPKSEKDLPAALLARGKEGFVEGLDYRGVPVLAALNKIPQSPWLMVSKIDREEIEAPLKKEAEQVFSIEALIVFFLGTLMLFLWRYQRAQYYKIELLHKRETQLLETEMSEMIVIHEIVYGSDGVPVDYRILDCNSVFTAVTGISRENALGVLASKLYGTSEAPYLDIYARVAETQNPERFESYFAPMNKYFIVSAFSTTPGRFTTLTTDITDQKLREKSFLWQKQLYAILSETNQAIVWLTDRESLFKEVCRIAVETGKMKMAWIGLIDEASRRIIPAEWNGIRKEELDSMYNNFESIDERKICYQAIKKRGTAYINNFSSENYEPSHWQSEALLKGYHSAAAFPIFFQEKEVGVMAMFSDENDFFGDEEVQLLEEMSLDISFALDTFETKRKQNNAEQLNKKKDELLRLTGDVAKVGGWEFDPATMDGNLTEEVARIFDMDPSESIDVKKLIGFFHKESKKKIDQAIKEAMEKGIPSDLELELTSAKGIQKWVHMIGIPVLENGNVVKIHGVFQDITEQKESEERIRESEKNYRQLTEFSTNGVLIHVDGSIVFANPSAVQILGGTNPNDLIGKRVLEFVHPDFKKSVTNRIQIVTDENKAVSPVEERLRRFDGTFIYSEVTAIPFEYRGKNAIQVVFSDITKRKQAEEALIAERSLLQTIVNNLPIALYIKDKEGKKLLTNPKDLENIGKPSLEVIGKTDLEVFPKEIAEKTIADDTSIIKGEKSIINREELLVNEKGESRWILTSKLPYKNNDGETIGIVGMGLDITERKKSEDEIRILSRAIEQSPVSIVITNVKGDIEYVNPTFCTTTGYSLADVLGKNPRILKSGETHPDTYKKMWGTIASGGEWHGEFHNKKKNGELYWENVFISPVKDEHGVVSHFLAVKENITDKKMMQEQLLQSQKVQSIGTLAAGIAHDFNNVLGIILAYSGFIKHSLHDENTVKNSIFQINKAVDRGASLVRQIMTFARKTDTSILPMSMNELIREIISMLNQTFPKIITIEKQIQKNLPYIKADQTKIHQAIMNLCVNARDAMPGGGRLTISVEVKRKEEIPNVHADAESEMYMAVSVSDTGTGIEEANLKQIFDPFFTTKEFGKGTGLGLSVVYGIVQMHKGFIDVKSTVGRGTTFIIYLPYQEETITIADRSQEKQEEFPRGSESILLVEDEVPLLLMVKDVLESYGYTVFTAVDGANAVEIYLEHKDKIDVVLTDLGLPNLTGTGEFKKLKQINPDVKVVFASGYYDTNVQSEFLKEGVKAFLQKPYDISIVLKTLRKVLDAHSQKN